MLTEVKIKKLRPGAIIPDYATPEAAGADLHACLDFPTEIKPGETVLIPTGLAMEFTKGYAGFVFARSGLSVKQGCAPANKVGIIDSDYRGEWFVPLHNHSNQTVIIEDGDRIAQAVFMEVQMPLFDEVDDLSETGRGSQGFGSTGK